MALSWTTLENAIVAAVRAASGLASGAVFWAEQNGDIPAGTYVSMRMGGIEADPTMTPEETRTTVGAVTSSTIRTPKRFTVSMQVFTSAARGDSSARAIASKIQSSLALPSIRGDLIAAGLGLLDAGAVQYVPGIKGTKFEGRAVLEPRFYALDEVTDAESGTWIETVNVEDVS